MRRTFLIVLLLAAVPLEAATVTGALRGRVTSEGKPVPAVAVVAYCHGSTTTPTVRTSKAGEFWFPELVPGLCDLTFSSPGLQSLTQRVEVRAGSETAADVDLPPGVEGESVTATSVKQSVLETSSVVWTITDELTAFLPNRRSLDGIRAYAPGAGAGATVAIEGIERRGAARFGLVDTLGPVSAVIAGAPAELQSYGGRLDLAALRAESLFEGSVRVTTERHEGETRTAGEVLAGGLPLQQLHLLGAFRRGSLFENLPDNQWLAAVDAAPSSSISVRAVAIGGRGRDDWSARSAMTFAQNAHGELHVSDGDRRFLGGSASVLVPAEPGAHELRAGIDTFRSGDGGDEWFVRDHWRVSDRWALDGGVRVEDGDVLPRAGVVFDLRGDGVTRVSASYGEYGAGPEAVRSREVVSESAVSLATTVVGSVRGQVTLLRRSTPGEDALNAAVIAAAYRYLIFDFGGNAFVSRSDSASTNSATVWVVADAPLLEHDVNVALVERLRGDFIATDLAVTYAWMAGRIASQAKLEFENVFGEGADARFEDARPRAIRFGIGVRFGAE